MPFKNISMTTRRPPSQTNVRPLNNCDAIEWNVNRSQIDCSCDSWFMGQAVHAEKRSKNDASIGRDVSVFTSTNYVTIWLFVCYDLSTLSVFHYYLIDRKKHGYYREFLHHTLLQVTKMFIVEHEFYSKNVKYIYVIDIIYSICYFKY